MTSAIVTIDLQYEFLDPGGSAAGHFQKATCVLPVRELLAAGRRSGYGIFHIQTVHDGPGDLPRSLRGRFPAGYCLRGDPSTALIAGLARDNEHVVEKQGFSALSGTSLADLLRPFSRVILSGLAMDCCVLATAFDVVNQTDGRLVIPYQVVSASSVKAYLASMEIVAKSLGSVVDLRELLNSGGHTETPLGLVDLRDSARAWMTPRHAYATQLTKGGTPTSGLTQARVDALLGELASFQATLGDSPRSASGE